MAFFVSFFRTEHQNKQTATKEGNLRIQSCLVTSSSGLQKAAFFVDGGPTFSQYALSAAHRDRGLTDSATSCASQNKVRIEGWSI